MLTYMIGVTVYSTEDTVMYIVSTLCCCEENPICHSKLYTLLTKKLILVKTTFPYTGTDFHGEFDIDFILFDGKYCMRGGVERLIIIA